MARVRLLHNDNPDIAAGLGALAREDRETALTHLLDAIRTTDGDLRDLVRQTMIGIFGELGDQHPLTVKFRRRLAQTLY
jgi:thioredoxin-like negative regulator of GroEL